MRLVLADCGVTSVLQTTEGLLDHKSTGGTTRTRRLAKERLVNAGTVIGLDEQLLEAPYKCTYVTSSFVHLFFFDKAQVCVVDCRNHRRVLCPVVFAVDNMIVSFPGNSQFHLCAV